MNAPTEKIEEIMSKPVATVEEAGKVLRIGRSQAYKLVKERKLRSLNVGRRVLIPTAAIREFLEKTDAA